MIDLGNLRNVRELGHGGFGRVYEVVDPNGVRAALKTLEPEKHVGDVLTQGELTARFAREVRYQSAMDHPNVVRILGHHLTGTPPWFVMPLAECTMEQELSKDRTFGGSLARVLYDILSGLEALHAAGYVHRDLKPSNVLRYRDPAGAPQYAVSDFGLMSSPNGTSTTLTPSDAGGGTPLYAAPELVTNLKRATPAADIYSFGAILHDIFVGTKRTPYSQLQGPGLIGEVIEKCTRRLPRLRYRDVVELREALFKALDGYTPTFSSDEEAHVVGMLNGANALTDDQWERVLLLMEQYEFEKRSLSNIFRALSVQHIASLEATSKDMFVAIASDFCAYVTGHRFDFDYCDVLAGKLDAIFKIGSVEIKALALLALLELGASHNRWFVEGKFMELASLKLDPQVAHRFLIEAPIQGVDVQARIAHVEWSISASRSVLSPIIQAAL
ncbi:serine/threonine-protein kinase [Paraburkholderia youngii]|uniref:serine/threonine-protein kinase n=1 Tax=Paraburkholderia youngii TaxID=2782701 RepID=UPI0015920A48|nr:serine/threonine-protein kinase [Paraburkholderia youngii]NUX55966.1 serine/threonine protein kinase [Paraburkholderia youngii]